jgi:hypothetical protein
MDKGAKKKLNPTTKSSLIYTKPNRKNKTKNNTYVIKKKANDKVVTQFGSEGGAVLEPTHLGAQGSHPQHEGASNGLSSKSHLKSMGSRPLEACHKEVVKIHA